ncbi:MAG: prenyltransferase [Thermoplasmata archaeon]|nr:prenyltransferase [Thermoplasmata archaeon]
MAMLYSTSIALVKMARPLIIVAGIISYALGLAMAQYEMGAVDLAAAFLGFVILISAIMMAHYADEYADVDTDSLTARTIVTGGSGVLISKQVPRSLALNAAVVSFGSAMILTAVGITSGILYPVTGLVVVSGLAGGWIYSMSPMRLIRRGWGELDNAILGGFLMPLLALASQTSEIPARAVLWCVPVFLIVMANLLGIHWADMMADRQSGKLTLVVRLGDRTRLLHMVVIASTYVYVFAFTGDLFPLEVSVATAATLPLGIYSGFVFMRTPKPILGAITMGAVMTAMTAGWLLA